MTDFSLPADLAKPFLFVRHGQTEYNLKGRLAGSVDIPLTDLGVQQAEAAAEALAEAEIRAVFASPLGRARRTGEIIAAPHGLPVTVIDGFRERNWGEIEGRPFPADLGIERPLGGEDMEAFLSRVGKALALFHSQTPADGYAVIAAHSGTFYALCRLLRVERESGIAGNATPMLFRPPHPGAAEARWTVAPASDG